jgi:hypothetical protein
MTEPIIRFIHFDKVRQKKPGGLTGGWIESTSTVDVYKVRWAPFHEDPMAVTVEDGDDLEIEL